MGGRYSPTQQAQMKEPDRASIFTIFAMEGWPTVWFTDRNMLPGYAHPPGFTKASPSRFGYSSAWSRKSTGGQLSIS